MGLFPIPETNFWITKSGSFTAGSAYPILPTEVDNNKIPSKAGQDLNSHQSAEGFLLNYLSEHSGKNLGHESVSSASVSNHEIIKNGCTSEANSCKSGISPISQGSWKPETFLVGYRLSLNLPLHRMERIISLFEVSNHACPDSALLQLRNTVSQLRDG